jgi:isopenicillin-N epimerase
VQEELAAYFGADPRDLFLRANITAALNDFLFALPLPADGEILATGWEYGATANIAKWRAEQGGLSFRQATLPLRADWGPDTLRDAVLNEIRSQTRVLVLSHVATGTGTILPVAEIARAAAARGVITVVDGAHAVGALPLNFREFGDVDFYGGNFHKWFLGPTGTAFGWVHPKWKGRLHWRFGGWATYSIPAYYQDFGRGDEEAARRFLPGTVDTAPFCALSRLLTFWREAGAAALRARQAELRRRAAAAGEALGWERLTPTDPRLEGPLVAFRKPSHWNGSGSEIAIRLYQEFRVQVALPEVQGETLLRLSPGVYGSEGEVDAGMERLARYA